MTVSLTTIHGCLEELEAVSNGLLWFDHLYGQVLDDIDAKRVTWDSVEAEAAKVARAEIPKAATAIEVKGFITRYVEQRVSGVEARDQLREAERRKDKIERWVRSLEQRLKAAQTAKGIHEQLSHGGGG